MHSRVRQLQIWDSTKKLSENAGWGRYATNHSYSREILLAILQYNVHHCPARRAINIIESSRDCTVRQQLQYFQFWCVHSNTVVRSSARKAHNFRSNIQAGVSECCRCVSATKKLWSSRLQWVDRYTVFDLVLTTGASGGRSVTQCAPSIFIF